MRKSQPDKRQGRGEVGWGGVDSWRNSGERRDNTEKHQKISSRTQELLDRKFNMTQGRLGDDAGHYSRDGFCRTLLAT